MALITIQSDDQDDNSDLIFIIQFYPFLDKAVERFWIKCGTRAVNTFCTVWIRTEWWSNIIIEDKVLFLFSVEFFVISKSNDKFNSQCPLKSIKNLLIIRIFIKMTIHVYVFIFCFCEPAICFCVLISPEDTFSEEPNRWKSRSVLEKSIMKNPPDTCVICLIIFS